MPPKKQIKTAEEKIIESYFPLDKDDLKHTTEKSTQNPIIKKDYLKKSVEKQVKDFLDKQEFVKGSVKKDYKKLDRNELETVEPMKGVKKIGGKISRKKSKKKTTKKSSRIIKKDTKFTLPKILLKKDGYELIITEKPQAASKISSALGNAIARDHQKIPYYELERDGKKIIVACAVGHLFSLKQNRSGSEVPIFDVSWVPNYLVRKKDFTKRYFDALTKLSKNAGSVTVATDYDVEGEVIGLNVVRFICGQKDANRMKFSTLTKPELEKAYDSKSPSINWGQAIAGETRHYLDWFYGINLSRALMNAIKTTGRFKIMSIGRVQGPALNLIVNKEREILKFKSKPFWQIFITIDDGKNKLELKHNKDIFDKKELERFKDLVGKTAIAETKKTEQIIPPNPPFNLTTLQLEAYKFHGISPKNTLQAAQSLYLSSLISYPRTSSQKLPAEIGYKEILKKVAKKYNAEKLITKEKPIEGKKTDPAHPSIYPTGNFQVLSGDEEKIYNLIVKRFISLFCDDAIIDNKTIKALVPEKNEDFSQLEGHERFREEKINLSLTSEVERRETENSVSEKEGKVRNQKNLLIFSTRGSQIRKKAWLEIYPSKLKETEIPDMAGEVDIVDSKIEQKETQPPKRYSQASIISELEKRNLGTKATRSSILETLYDRNYVKEKSIEATPLGISLISTLEKYSPIIIDEKLTRHFENEMESILESKKDFKEKEDKIIEESKKTIKNIAKDFEKNETKIGSELLQANDDLIAQQKVENTLTQCPKCKKGNLAITYSRKTRRHFVACDGYPDCKNTFSLPPNGTIKKTGKVCEECNFPLLQRLQKGRRPWEFCFNSECPTNKERIDEYKKKLAEEKNNPKKE